jgi:t-SNARE complex subunit (syntaxin)
MISTITTLHRDALTSTADIPTQPTQRALDPFATGASDFQRRQKHFAAMKEKADRVQQGLAQADAAVELEISYESEFAHDS